MRIRTRLAVWYSAILLVGLLLVGGFTYYEMAVEHPNVAKALAKEGHTPVDELDEIMLFGGLPALLLALVGGWFLMRQALAPMTTLTRALERVHAHTLRQQLPRTGNGDELDRLTEVFNSMTARLDTSFTHFREFTLHASHELKTPLALMRTELEMALREQPLMPTQRDLFANQLEEIQRLTKIVDGLTLLAKADSGHAKLNWEPLRLDELVKDSFTDAQLLAQTQKIEVTLEACEPITLRGDRHRLRQLLLNLTDNAIKYNQPQGRVTIALSRNNGVAELRIANSGAGIRPENLPRVFDRFFRCDPARSSGVEGCGLGLSIAEWIVKAHAGTIQLRSEPEALTTVTVMLPVDSRTVPP